MAQRHSNAQSLANSIDLFIPLLRWKFAEDGTDETELQLLHYISAVNDYAFHQADLKDTISSVDRIGLNERNLQRIKDLAAGAPPELPEPIDPPRLLMHETT